MCFIRNTSTLPVFVIIFLVLFLSFETNAEPILNDQADTTKTVTNPKSASPKMTIKAHTIEPLAKVRI